MAVNERKSSRAFEARLTQIARCLSEIYALDVDLDVARYVMDPKRARPHAPPRAPRTGVLVVEESEFVWLGLYVDSRDRGDLGTLIEDTSHLLCLAQHARWNLPVSRVALELQGEVDRFIHARGAWSGPVSALSSLSLGCSGLAPEALDRYRTAHRRGERYCRRLARRFPRKSDTPGLWSELRHFYRASPLSKLAIADT